MKMTNWLHSIVIATLFVGFVAILFSITHYPEQIKADQTDQQKNDSVRGPTQSRTEHYARVEIVWNPGFGSNKHQCNDYSIWEGGLWFHVINGDWHFVPHSVAYELIVAPPRPDPMPAK